jgi:hypothetical protein
MMVASNPRFDLVLRNDFCSLIKKKKKKNHISSFSDYSFLMRVSVSGRGEGEAMNVVLFN